MRALTLLLAVGLTLVAGAPSETPQRIIGGSVTTITQYPYVAALLFTSTGSTFGQSCGGSILNNRAILTAAHCLVGDSISHWRIRVGSSYASSGGVVHNTNRIIPHPNFNRLTNDNDIAVIQSVANFAFNNNVRAGSLAGANYVVNDNSVVWALGWGRTSYGGWPSEQLRHVQIWTVNQAVCRNRYAPIGYTVTDNMMCSGWLDVGGRDQCTQDSGSPLIHNGIIVGVCSWRQQCGLAYYPGVNTRVPRYTSWILANV